ncbi:MAG: RluA family pseudouridine synthase [Clostridia bacterium]|nr:RluA family pseudouridine synthase [Clostridia bacterium]
MPVLSFSVSQEYDGISVYNFLRAKCGVSYRLIKKLKRVPLGITANGQHIRTIDSLSGGDRVTLRIPEDDNPTVPVELPVDIVYEDGHIAVLNKPYGMPVHPAREHVADTLANAFSAHLLANGEPNAAFRVINRLDRDTSGLVLTAKNSHAASLLHGHTDKVYYAICQGTLTGSGTIDAPIRIMEGHGIQREVGEGGVRAVTHWKAVRNMSLFAGNGSRYDLTLLEIHLETGRTHQIRVHFTSLGMPLAGDDMYGGSRDLICRQALHCGQIDFNHPMTGEHMHFSVPLPEDMAALWAEPFCKNASNAK